MISFSSEHPCKTGRTGIIMIILKDGKTDTGWTQSKPALNKNFCACGPESIGAARS